MLLSLVYCDLENNIWKEMYVLRTVNYDVDIATKSQAKLDPEVLYVSMSSLEVMQIKCTAVRIYYVLFTTLDNEEKRITGDFFTNPSIVKFLTVFEIVKR